MFKKLRDEAEAGYEKIAALLIEVTNPAITDARQDQISDILQVELQNMNEDVKNILLQFSNQGFKDYVQIEQINDLQSNFVDISKYGELQDLCPQPQNLWDRTMELVKKLHTIFQNFTKSALECIVIASAKTTLLIESAINNAFLFVPGLNVIAILWRVAKLSLFIFKSIKFFAQARKENRIEQKYTLYGKSFGSFMRGLVYLAIG